MHGTEDFERVLPQPEASSESPDPGNSLDDTNILDYWTRTDVTDQIDSSQPEDHPDSSTQDGLSSAEGDRVYYIGIHQDRVAVFEGLPAEGRLFRLTDRPVDSLPPREVAALKDGVRIAGEKEMLEALEGYLQ